MTLTSLSSATSASDFKINNHKLFMLPLISLLLHSIPCGNTSIRNVLEIHKLPKPLSLPRWHFLWHLGIGVELTHENLQTDLGLLCFPVFPLFSFFLSSLDSQQGLGISYNQVVSPQRFLKCRSSTVQNMLPHSALAGNLLWFCATPAFTHYATDTGDR